jgi:D-3-phosphoglycerate dehydrogenase / 2-oxoglutarate reductase
MSHKIYICDRFHADALEMLKSNPDLSITHEISPFPNLQKTYDHNILVTRSRTKVNDALLQSFPNLKMIASATSGFDHIDLNLIKDKNLQAEYCPDANADSAAELTWGLLLSATRFIAQAHNRVLQAMWRDERLSGSQLKGKTIFIIGFGRIGKRVGQFAQAFQMKVLVYDPYIDTVPSWAHKVELEDGLQKCDFLTLHVPKTNKTFHLLNAHRLSLLPEHAVVINTSRGDVIEEKALIHALSKKTIQAAGLDVFSKEPLAENAAIYELSNVVLSPHAGAFTEEAFKQGSIQCAEKVLAYAKGEPASDPLPPKAKWVEDLDTML